MNSDLPPTKEGLLSVADNAVRDTIDMFFRCPRGFHGDTGIQHFLFHRIVSNAGDRLVWPSRPEPGRSSFLLHVEHHTRLRYCKKGATPGQGRFDLALIDPDSVPDCGDSPDATKGSAFAAFEVGRNKAPCPSGALDAPKEATPEPADEVKLFRELKYCPLDVGYLLAFFDGNRGIGKARRMCEKLAARSDEIGGERFRIAIVVFRMKEARRKAVCQVWTYPVGWRERLSLPWDVFDPIGGEVSPRPGPRNRTDETGFGESCSPGARALLEGISAAFPGTLRLLYGTKSMTVNRRPKGCLMRLTGLRNDRGERICGMSPEIESYLRRELPSRMMNSEIEIPAEPDQVLISAAVGAVGSALRGAR